MRSINKADIDEVKPERDPREDYFPIWCYPLPELQDTFFMAISYDPLCLDLKFNHHYASSGDDLIREFLNDEHKIFQVYVVSLSNQVPGLVPLEQVEKMTYGYVYDEQNKHTSNAYRVHTKTNNQYTFSEFGEISSGVIHEEKLLFTAKSLFAHFTY